jgi:hypothetical protein
MWPLVARLVAFCQRHVLESVLVALLLVGLVIVGFQQVMIFRSAWSDEVERTKAARDKDLDCRVNMGGASRWDMRVDDMCSEAARTVNTPAYERAWNRTVMGWPAPLAWPGLVMDTFTARYFFVCAAALLGVLGWQLLAKTAKKGKARYIKGRLMSFENFAQHRELHRPTMAEKTVS